MCCVTLWKLPGNHGESWGSKRSSVNSSSKPMSCGSMSSGWWFQHVSTPLKILVSWSSKPPTSVQCFKENGSCFGWKDSLGNLRKPCLQKVLMKDLKPGSNGSRAGPWAGPFLAEKSGPGHSCVLCLAVNVWPLM